jgi:hypothetical protein
MNMQRFSDRDCSMHTQIIQSEVGFEHAMRCGALAQLQCLAALQATAAAPLPT